MDFKIKLVDDLIKENPEATIKDYLEVLSEIKQVNDCIESSDYEKKKFNRAKIWETNSLI